MQRLGKRPCSNIPTGLNGSLGINLGGILQKNCFMKRCLYLIYMVLTKELRNTCKIGLYGSSQASW